MNAKESLDSTQSQMTIGVFARRTGISAPRLRRYDEMGLLRASRVDADTRYRYYDARQMGDAETVRLLRDLEVPVDDIKILLESSGDSAVHSALVEQRHRLVERLQHGQEVLARIDRFLSTDAALLPTRYCFEIRDMAAVRVITARELVRSQSHELEGAQGRCRIAVERRLAAEGLTAAGPVFFVLSFAGDELDWNVDTEVTACAPIGENAEPTARSEELPACRAVCTTHPATWQDLRSSFAAAVAWTAQEGYGLAGVSRLTYVAHDSRGGRETSGLVEVARHLTSV